MIRPVVRVTFRATLDGAEHLPWGRPFILVANHSGAIAVAELVSFAALAVDHVGPGRRLAGFAHPFGFSMWPASLALRAIGAVPSTYDDAYSTLDKGVALLIFPGGDHEAARPVWKANTVDFGGRLGFLRIARTARVPVVPMGIRGSHYTAPILWCSRKVLPNVFFLMRLFGLKRYPLTVLGVAGVAAIWLWWSFAWPWKLLLSWVWLGATILPLLPWVPWKVGIRIGAPLQPESLFRHDGTDDELRVALARVEREVQALVDPVTARS